MPPTFRNQILANLLGGPSLFVGPIIRQGIEDVGKGRNPPEYVNIFADLTVGVAGTGGRGRIASNALEMSNVDMASEFVRMITTQRAYQANARVISTSDELLAELMMIKR